MNVITVEDRDFIDDKAQSWKNVKTSILFWRPPYHNVVERRGAALITRTFTCKELCVFCEGAKRSRSFEEILFIWLQSSNPDRFMPYDTWLKSVINGWENGYDVWDKKDIKFL